MEAANTGFLGAEPHLTWLLAMNRSHTYPEEFSGAVRENDIYLFSLFIFIFHFFCKNKAPQLVCLRAHVCVIVCVRTRVCVCVPACITPTPTLHRPPPSTHSNNEAENRRKHDRPGPGARQSFLRGREGAREGASESGREGGRGEGGREGGRGQ